MYKSEMHNAKETKEILKKGSPDVFFRWYHKKKKGPTHPGGKIVNNPNEGKMTLAKLAIEMRAGFKQVNSRIDKLEKRIDNIDARLDNVEKRLDYNALQIEQINKRLDYNALQIEQINKRLDYNGLQIEQINKRLDYNNLKQLPKR